MVIVIDLLVAVVGILMYALCTNPKLQEIGRILFFSGMLAFLLIGGEKVISLLGTGR